MSQKDTLRQKDARDSEKLSTDEGEFRIRIVWLNAFVLAYGHITAPYGLYLAFTSAMMYTNIFAFILYVTTMLGITAGAHRLWAHRTYKAALPVEILLMIFFTAAFQGPILNWARDHRLHHKYSDTDADPYNASRSFFFAHVGWLFMRKNPQVILKGKGIRVDDLEENSVVMFQRRYYVYLMPFLGIILPTILPVYLWNEAWRNAFFVAFIFRWMFTLNIVGFVNSLAHTYGPRPYDRNIQPVESKIVSLVSLGEGWHNYHHTFPWDYKAGEVKSYVFNFSTAVIDTFTRFGWTYDLKFVSADQLERRIERTGDGTHHAWGAKS